MALIQSEINRPQVFTAKCSEPQADTIKVGVKEVVYEQKLDTRLNGGQGCYTNRSPKGKRKTKRVNQDVVKEIGLVNYPGRPHRQ